MAHRYISSAEGYAILKGVAEYVAGQLEGFTYTLPIEDDYSHKLVGPNEAVLYLRVEGDTMGDRIEIGGSFHVGLTAYGNTEFVRPKSGVPSDITVSLARGNEAIAREIKNRYLPKYLAALAEAIAQRDADTAYKNKQTAILTHLALVAGCRTPDLHGHSVRLGIGEIYGSIEAYGDSVTLELRSMTMKQAEAVIKLLKK